MTERQKLKIIGENVRIARRNANMTQECVAELVGVTWQTVSYIENGKNPFSVLILNNLASALQTTPNRLLEGLPSIDPERMQRVKQAMARKRAARKS